MLGFKVLALVAALASGIVAHDVDPDTCAPAVTVTVTVQDCGTPGVPVPTMPVSSYEVPASLPPPAASVESTATAPLSSPPETSTTEAPPAPPADTGVPVQSSGEPLGPVPSSDMSIVPGPSSGASAPGTTAHPSSTAGMTRPSPSTSTPATVSTAGGVLAIATPYMGLGSLLAAGAVLNAALAVV